MFTFSAVQPNKVYIGGLPENTRKEDLENCFGKIGTIVNIELKYVFFTSYLFPAFCLCSWRQSRIRLCGALKSSNLVVPVSSLLSLQEFDSSDAADESVAKYNEGFFMGNKIRVEISHGGGRAAAHQREPGACFRCGQMGHWAR